jgi:hypothetical protein
MQKLTIINMIVYKVLIILCKIEDNIILLLFLSLELNEERNINLES